MSLPVHTIALIVSITIISFVGHDVFAQVQTSEQTTLSGNLANDPLAQDILKKIEQTKQWIADLEQREYEKIEAQKFLDERRAVALESLNRDLKAWEDLWINYTSRNAFERFVEKKPVEVQGVFWDQFEFKEMKVNAGRAALKKVLAEGGTLKDARNAYLKAAETKRIELIEANAQFNVKHNLALYSQQILFDVQGQFVNSTENIEKLSQYYTDFRASPGYLAANPDDTISYEYLGNTYSDTQCREGYVILYRYHARDYACITDATAELWVQRGMGEIPGTEHTAYSDEKKFGTPQYTQEAIENKDLQAIVYSINQEFQKLNDEIESEKVQLIKKFNMMYDVEKQEARDEEKRIINENHSKITDKELSDLILAIREKYQDSMEEILNDKIRALDELEKKIDKYGLGIKQNYENNQDIDVIWDSDSDSYLAVRRTSNEYQPEEKTNNEVDFTDELEIKIDGDKEVRRGTTHTLEIQIVRGDMPIEGAQVFLDIEDYGENIIKESKGYTNSKGYFIFSWEIPQSFNDIKTLLAIVDVTDGASAKTKMFKFQVYCLPGEFDCKIEGN